MLKGPVMNNYDKIINLIDSTVYNQALETAFRLRSCPPPSLRGSDEFERHLQQCSFCREKQINANTALSPWINLAKAFEPILKEEFDLVSSLTSHLCPGQIRTVKRNLAGWGNDDYYYKAPSVILLKAADMIDCFQVAQIYEYEEMQGTDDIPLFNFGGFAEPWNVYTLHKEHLGELLGEESVGVVVNIWNKFCDLREQEIEGESSEFVQLERRVSSFFNRKSAALVLEIFNSNQKEENDSVPGNVLDFEKYKKLREVDKIIYPKAKFLKNAGLQLAAACGNDENVFNVLNNSIKVTVSWDNDSIHISTSYVGSEFHNFILYFINPNDDSIYKSIRFSSKKNIKAPFTAEYLAFRPYTDKWTIRIGIDDDK